MACLNKEGCALACYLFGGPPDSSRREAIDWLVRARCPVLTYDSLRLLANECIDSPPRRPLDLRAAFDGYVTDVHPSAVPEEKCVDVCASPVSERAPTPVVSVHAPSPVDGELSDVLAPVVGASLLGADAARPPDNGSSPLARHINRLKDKLLSWSYVNVLQYSAAHREAIGMLNTKPSSSRLTVSPEGQIKSEFDEGEDVAVTSSWRLFRCGYIFIVRAMCELPSRLPQVADRLAFLQFLDNRCFHMGEKRMRYAEQFMFTHSRSSEWESVAFSDNSLLFNFTPALTAGHPSSSSSSLGASSSSKKRKKSSAQGRVPTMEAPLNFCRSRICKTAAACTRGGKCRYLHTCPYCVGGPDHSAQECPKAPQQ